MAQDTRYGPSAQTPTQRAYVLQQMLAAQPHWAHQASVSVQQLYARYVAGELTWSEVCAQRDALVAAHR
jgi:hypothetical protein